MNTRTQDRSFCFFCGDHVAVTNGYLADHGYRVPGFGHRTTGCPGSNMSPNELTTKQIEKSLRINAEYIENAPARIAEVIAKGGKTWTVNTEVTRIESRVQSAKMNIEIATAALAKWTPGTLITVDIVKEAEDKKNEVRNTRRASLEAKLDKVPARKERAYKNYQKALKTWASSENAEVDARMHESCTKDYEYELRRIEFDVNEWTTKLGLMK